MLLLNTPCIEFMESPASWLSRVALSQHVPLREVRRVFGLPNTRELDFFFAGRSISKIVSRKIDQRAPEWQQSNIAWRFRAIESVLRHLRYIDQRGRRYLLGSRAKPEYRYCPVCLAGDRVPYFRIEWRFRCWHWCPLHQCLLKDKCSACDSRIVLPIDMINAGKDEAGVALLDRCMACEHHLSLNWQAELNSIPQEQLTSLEHCLLMNGRAVLSAMKFGYMFEGNTTRVDTLHRLRRFERLRLIPITACPIDIFNFRNRIEQAAESRTWPIDQMFDH